MEGMFRQIGIYSAKGQLYDPADSGQVMYYREDVKGQLLEEGINEAGAMSSWISAATSYSVNNYPLIPFYIYYSMFGFQRVGDLIWAGADQRARGFLIGATAGRTTLGGEGLQHQDGSSLINAAMVPNCRAYDPAFAGELAVILEHGMRAMLEQDQDVFYYLTLTNENYAQQALPEGVRDDVIRGMYRLATFGPRDAPQPVRLLGSGAILGEVIAAARLLADDWNLASEVWSVTSYSELAREANALERQARLDPSAPVQSSHLQRCLAGNAPVIAASDWVRAWPQTIASYLSAPFTTLGTDGFGRSDSRQALREFFEVDRHHVALAALHALARYSGIDATIPAQAIERYKIHVESAAPWER